MTTNQIEYAKLLETRRANTASEALTAARDAANKELGFSTLGETMRSNMAKEKISLGTLSETKRNNLIKEDLQRLSQEEVARYNRAKEALERSQQSETHRANVAKEAENVRSHMAQEGAALRTHAETVRANKAKENELTRSHLAGEAETQRHNLATEGISRIKLGSDYLGSISRVLAQALRNSTPNINVYGSSASAQSGGSNSSSGPNVSVTDPGSSTADSEQLEKSKQPLEDKSVQVKKGVGTQWPDVGIVLPFGNVTTIPRAPGSGVIPIK